METLNNEVWKPVKDFEDSYEVSNLGNVRSITRKVRSRWGKYKTVEGKELKPLLSLRGYYYIDLKRNQISTKRLIHRMVATAFIDNPFNKKQVNHKNGIKTDNRLENLEWCTQSENQKHAFATGLNISPMTRKKLGL